LGSAAPGDVTGTKGAAWTCRPDACLAASAIAGVSCC
jgi:hypothetical protein